MTTRQISLVTLLSEDNMNPMLHILKMSSSSTKNGMFPASMHWYIDKNCDKRVKMLDFTGQKKTEIQTFTELIHALDRHKDINAIDKAK